MEIQFSAPIQIPIPEGILKSILSQAIDDPEWFFNYVCLFDEFEEFVKCISGNYTCGLNNKNGRLVFQVWNCLLETNKGLISSEIESDFESLINDYVDWSEDWPTKDMRNHANILRDFAEKIDKECDARDADELDNE